MSRAGSALLLGITLCCVAAWAKEKIEVHEVCPIFDPETCKTGKPGGAQCRSDKECHKHQKCCCVKCGRQCIETVEVKQGRCPPKVANCTTMTHSDTSCKSDFDCPHRQKCCDQCGNVCREPMKEKFGICPKSDQKEVECSAVRCRANTDCPPNQKCCQFEGKQTCMNI